MRGIAQATVRSWRADRQRLIAPAATVREAIEAIPPLAAGPSAYLSLWGRVRPRPGPAEVEALVEGREAVVPHVVAGLGDVLVPPSLVPAFAAARLYRLRRDLRRSKRVRAQEEAFERAAAPLYGTLSGRPSPPESKADRAVLDGLCARGRAEKSMAAGRLDGAWGYARAPRIEAEAERLVEGWSFLEDLALHYLKVAGPATRDDFAWWSGASTAAARRTIEELAGVVEEVDIEGGRQAHFMIEEDVAALRRYVPSPGKHVALLPSLDPVRFAWPEGFALLASERLAPRLAPPTRRRAGAVTAGARVALLGGAAVGTWRVGDGGRVEVDVLGRFDGGHARAIDEERARLETSLERDLPWAAPLRWL